MGLNIQKGNMYPFVTHTWNPIKGKCAHDCEYCYMKVFPQKPIRYFLEELKTNLGTGNFIFVGSSTDMWAENVRGFWIEKVLDHINKSGFDNQYLFQSKNPARFLEAAVDLTEKSILGTTIESNRNYDISKAPSVTERASSLNRLSSMFETMVSIEPVIDFDLPEMLSLIKKTRPKFVSIGADSKGHHLPEPSSDKIKELICRLELFTSVKIKSNLKRLIG